ncbi:MAG TPA: hypothetical protein VFM97_00040 [Gammaproteobacteria bacterium]|nr:hypothetical protein [Gammaproteobacteria bacterium]
MKSLLLLGLLMALPLAAQAGPPLPGVKVTVNGHAPKVKPPCDVAIVNGYGAVNGNTVQYLYAADKPELIAASYPLTCQSSGRFGGYSCQGITQLVHQRVRVMAAIDDLLLVWDSNVSQGVFVRRQDAKCIAAGG